MQKDEQEKVGRESAETKQETATAKRRTKDIELDETNLTFDDILLSKPVLEGLKNAGFYKPSPIQLKAIPLGKLGLDLIVQAKSGTGKTCVFSVISLEHILSLKSKALQVLIVAPTREVAIQIADQIKAISVSFSSLVKCNTFIGGSSVKQDKQKLKSCQIAIGTPGRILHLMNEDLINTKSIRIFILDEADKLLAPEFQDSVNEIYSKLPENKQIIFLSATYPSYMASYATRYMRSPTFVRLNIVDPSLRGIKQYYKITAHSQMSNISFDHKVDALLKLLSNVQFQQAIIFTNYQIKGESLCNTLTSSGWPAIFISGSKEQNQRNYAIAQLKQFKCRILVSTDLTARGIDAQNVDLVVSMDIPADSETYLHRIGRAGRYGALGIAVTFVSEKDELAQFHNIIDSYNLSIKQYNEDLNDVVLTRNDTTEANRIDDVTIQRVNLTRQQLNKSLFEYEQHKSSSQQKYSLQHEYDASRSSNDTNKKSRSAENKLKLRLSANMNTLEQLLQKYAANPVNDQQLAGKAKLINEQTSTYRNDQINLNEIVQRRAIIQRELNKIFNPDTKQPTEDKKAKAVNLNDIYKWIAVEKSDKNEHSNKKPQQITQPSQTCDNTYDFNTFNSYYSNYFSHFYQYYFNKLNQ